MLFSESLDCGAHSTTCTYWFKFECRIVTPVGRPKQNARSRCAHGRTLKSTTDHPSSSSSMSKKRVAYYYDRTSPFFFYSFPQLNQVLLYPMRGPTPTGW